MSKTSSPIQKPAASKAKKFSVGPTEGQAVGQAKKVGQKIGQAKKIDNKRIDSKKFDGHEIVEGKIDARLVREIANLLSDSDLTEIEVEKGDLRIRVSRQNNVLTPPASFAPGFVPSVAAAPGVALAEATAPGDAHAAADVLKSPMVGTVYLRPSPDAKAFVELGTHVTQGQKVLLVEAMKTFNDIVAHKSGAVTALLVEDGQPVEYGQPLLVIA